MKIPAFFLPLYNLLNWYLNWLKRTKLKLTWLKSFKPVVLVVLHYYSELHYSLPALNLWCECQCCHWLLCKNHQIHKKFHYIKNFCVEDHNFAWNDLVTCFIAIKTWHHLHIRKNRWCWTKPGKSHSNNLPAYFKSWTWHHLALWHLRNILDQSTSINQTFSQLFLPQWSCTKME